MQVHNGLPMMAFPDPRWFQVCALSALLVASMTLYDLAATPLQAVVTIGTALAVQALFCAGFGARFEALSPAITGLSLSILLRTHEPWLWAAAAGLGIASKFLLRVGGKHLFNPAAFGIVVLLAADADVWVSPGQWGTAVWLAAALVCAGALVLSRARRAGTAAAFLGCYGGLIGMRAWWLGDPWTIPLHQVQTGSLLLFACFMITDPRSTPNHPAARLLFAAVVAVAAYWLQFVWQVRTGAYWALAGAAVLTPVLDAVLPATRFRWQPLGVQ